MIFSARQLNRNRKVHCLCIFISLSQGNSQFRGRSHLTMFDLNCVGLFLFFIFIRIVILFAKIYKTFF